MQRKALAQNQRFFDINCNNLNRFFENLYQNTIDYDDLPMGNTQTISFEN